MSHDVVVAIIGLTAFTGLLVVWTIVVHVRDWRAKRNGDISSP